MSALFDTNMSSTDVAVIYGARIPVDKIVDLVYQLTDTTDILPRPTDNEAAYKLVREGLYDGYPIDGTDYELVTFTHDDGNRDRAFIMIQQEWVHTNADEEPPIKLQGPSKERKAAFKTWLAANCPGLSYGKYLVVCDY